MGIQTSAKPAVLWLRARQLCYLGGHAPQSGVIVGILQKLKDDMPADLADSQADEEHRKTDREPFFTAKENEEVATVTATIETNLRRGHLTEDGDGEQRGVVRVGGGAPEEQGRRTWEQILAKEVISTVDDMVFVAVRQHGRMCTEKGRRLACQRDSGWTHNPKAVPIFFVLDSLVSPLFLSLRHRNPTAT